MTLTELQNRIHAEFRSPIEMIFDEDEEIGKSLLISMRDGKTDEPTKECRSESRRLLEFIRVIKTDASFDIETDDEWINITVKI